MTSRRLLVTLLWLASFAFTTGARAEDVLDGTYLGVDDADGARIEIAPDDSGFRGTFYDAAGQEQDFMADRVGTAAEAVLDMDGRTVLLRMVPLPFGAEVALIPFDADGMLITAEGRLVGFRREDVALPTLPDDFVDPPRDTRSTIAANSFLASYAFWPPSGVVNGYLSMPSRFQTIFRMFPAVQLDVIWKLCQAPNADAALGIAMRGQGVRCDEVLGVIAQTQRDGRFSAYKADVAADSAVLRSVVRCADNDVESKETCDAAAVSVARAATSMQTAARVLARYR